MLFCVSIEYVISLRCSLFSQKNVGFSEPLGFSTKTKGFSGADLAHLEPSNTKVDLRSTGKTRGQTMYQFLKVVFSTPQALGLILCYYTAEDINRVSSN